MLQRPPHRDTGSDPSLAGASVALINMPFALSDRPSIQCGVLKAALGRAGHHATVHYLNLELAAELGASFYRVMSLLRVNVLLGDWLFSVAAFGPRAEEAEYRAACGAQLEEACSQLGTDFQRLCDLRNHELPAWIERWAEAIDWGRNLAVGFTCSYEQNTAAFALARALKERHPEIVTIFGGANFDGAMGREYTRALPFIDYAVLGEGDVVLPQILDRVANGESAVGLPGVVARAPGGLSEAEPSMPIRDLDQLADPDYDEYFETLFRLGPERVLGKALPHIPFETSRGCWWGEKQHCVFCGLNDESIRYRSKSPERALGELQRLASRYHILDFDATDNILDFKYLDRFCRSLAEKRYDFRFFYEVKANLTPAQIRTIAQAGFSSIQPGIESLSSHVLSLMRKGTTLLRNLRLLKWAHYHGMRVSWNILTGFPGETEEDYLQQLRVLRLVRHLPPPSGNTRISLERFSPVFNDPSFPVTNVRPSEAYRFIYPEERLRLDEIAYFFQHEMGSTLPDEFHSDLHEEIEHWKAAWERRPRPALAYQRAPRWIQIVDRRTPEIMVHAFHDRAAAIYELCSETERTAEALEQHLAGPNQAAAGQDEIQEILARFCGLGLMLEERGRYLSLALPVNSRW